MTLRPLRMEATAYVGQQGPGVQLGNQVGTQVPQVRLALGAMHTYRALVRKT